MRTSNKLQYMPMYNINDDLYSERSRLYKEFWQWWREVIILLLLISTLSLSYRTTGQTIPKIEVDNDRSPYRLTSSEERWIEYNWHSYPYSSNSSEDAEAVNAAWNQIVPAHGFVAIDHSLATQMELPASMNLPSDHNKGVYIIDAYHQLHCLTVLRRTFLELQQGQVPHYPIEHSLHCFDGLRQYVMCGTPGDTLLYTWGRNQTGDGQIRKCRDWGSMRDWATKNTACYRDTEHGVPLREHFGHCDDGTDGFDIQAWQTVLNVLD